MEQHFDEMIDHLYGLSESVQSILAHEDSLFEDAKGQFELLLGQGFTENNDIKLHESADGFILR